ncbi:hypothetical protein, partial [Nostoc sp. UIC 10630]|uniref:hypothetical protein n=1 Tax=Nostoc sp. UIC 10630 TaxID=2100146 RepID=UPI001A9CAF3A
MIASFLVVSLLHRIPPHHFCNFHSLTERCVNIGPQHSNHNPLFPYPLESSNHINLTFCASSFLLCKQPLSTATGDLTPLLVRGGFFKVSDRATPPAQSTPHQQLQSPTAETS